MARPINRRWTTVNIGWDTHEKVKQMAQTSSQTMTEIIKQAVDLIWEQANSPEGFNFNVKVVLK